MKLPLTFLVLQSFILSSGSMVAMSGNPMYSVLFLVLCFLNTSLLIGYLGNLFMCLLILIIYLGAIAILFIFIVMMINLKNDALDKGYSFLEMTSFLFFTSFVSLIFMNYFNNSFYAFDITDKQSFYNLNLIFNFIDYSKIQHHYLTAVLLGQVLFVQYFYPFLLSGVVLLVAMVGAIVISSDTESSSKILKQQVYVQLSRNHKNAIYKYR